MDRTKFSDTGKFHVLDERGQRRMVIEETEFRKTTSDDGSPEEWKPGLKVYRLSSGERVVPKSPTEFQVLGSDQVLKVDGPSQR